MSGRLSVVGLGPGDDHWLTLEASALLGEAEDIFGYGPYLARLKLGPRQRAHASGNGDERARAEAALALAAAGANVAVVSGGDPGVFAMAAAVVEAIDAGPPEWRALPLQVSPGISAMQGAAARLGAPLGHDFCAISLSDNLKPWAIIAQRLKAGAEGDFVIALYNPASKARPNAVVDAFALLRALKSEDTPSQPGDIILGQSLAAGGHLTHGAAPNQSGKWFKAVQYGVKADTQLHRLRGNRKARKRT